MIETQINWNNVKDYISASLICKEPRVSCLHSLFGREISKRGTGMGEYLYHTFLKLSSVNSEKKFLLTYNDKPYYIGGDVTQLILWTNPKGITKQNKVGKRGKKRNPFYYNEWIIEQIQKKLGLSSDEIIVFEDASHNLRTRAIQYVNILISRKDDQAMYEQLKTIEYFVQ